MLIVKATIRSTVNIGNCVHLKKKLYNGFHEFLSSYWFLHTRTSSLSQILKIILCANIIVNSIVMNELFKKFLSVSKLQYNFKILKKIPGNYKKDIIFHLPEGSYLIYLFHYLVNNNCVFTCQYVRIYIISDICVKSDTLLLSQPLHTVEVTLTMAK